MDKFQDQDYLLREQYADEANLEARIKLHARFSTNPYSWFLWVFDHFDLPPACSLLELGCGPGDLWLENNHRLSPAWSLTLTDISLGMVQKARERLQDEEIRANYAVVDAQHIPFPDQSFQGVIGNNMFYHVPDRQRSLREIRRVLKSGGQFFAATTGEEHLQELPALVARFDPSLAENHAREKNAFTLESGKTQLAAHFPEVHVYRQENSLQITEVEPLVAYVLSDFRSGVKGDQEDEFRQFVRSQMAKHGGVIRITKDSGMLVALDS